MKKKHAILFEPNTNLLVNHYFKMIITYIFCSVHFSDETVADDWNVKLIVIQGKVIFKESLMFFYRKHEHF